MTCSDFTIALTQLYDRMAIVRPTTPIQQVKYDSPFEAELNLSAELLKRFKNCLDKTTDADQSSSFVVLPHQVQLCLLSALCALFERFSKSFPALPSDIQLKKKPTFKNITQNEY